MRRPLAALVVLLKTVMAIDTAAPSTTARDSIGLPILFPIHLFEYSDGIEPDLVMKQLSAISL